MNMMMKYRAGRVLKAPVLAALIHTENNSHDLETAANGLFPQGVRPTDMRRRTFTAPQPEVL
jgi:hypothetical protein